jgi:hypothetical protein
VKEPTTLVSKYYETEASPPVGMLLVDASCYTYYGIFRYLLSFISYSAESTNRNGSK